MYNFAKLLTEGPEKLERLIILFLKFLLTLWVTLTLFEVDITLKEIFNDEVFSNHTLTPILVFSFSFICVWIGMWLICINLLLGLIINLLSKIGNADNRLKAFLWATGVIDINDKPKDNVIIFADELDQMAKEDFNTYSETATRLFQYFSIALVTYIIFLWSKDVVFSTTTNYIIIGVLFVLFLAQISATRMSNYFDASLLELRKKFRKMAYFQITKNALNTITNYDYNINPRTRRIFLEKKEKHLSYPPIEITPVYSWNYSLDEKKMVDDLRNASEKISDDDSLNITQDNQVYNVIVTNIKPDAVKEFISKLDMGIFIYAETKEDIENGIEEMFYKINKENRKRLNTKVTISVG